MFSRRKTRSAHETAYTGVGRTAPTSSQQPNSGALAAALTIGNALKQQNQSAGRAATTKKPQQSNIPRSTSFQYKTVQQPHQAYKTQQPHSNSINSTGSLLKRGSRASIQSNPQQHHPQPLHAPRTFSASSRGSSASSRHSTPLTSAESVPQQHQHTQVYDIDDSFNDSYLDEITEETTQAYLSNRANMKDLKLPTQTRTQPVYKTTVVAKKSPIVSPTSPQLQQSFDAPVKMVKKYVPSPTGIKVIEVPEAQFQKEVARSNSMRSSSLMSRSGSLRNVSLTKRNNIPRSSSLSGVSRQLKQTPTKAASAATTGTRSASSPLKSMHEDVALEESLGHSDELHEQKLKYQILEKEIEEEKRLAAQIELKRKEYEKLKKTRLENEQKLRDLEHENDLDYNNNSITTESTVIHTPQEECLGIVEEGDNSEEDVPILRVPPAVDELEKKTLQAVQVTNAIDDEVDSEYSEREDGLPENDHHVLPVETADEHRGLANSEPREELHHAADIHSGTPHQPTEGEIHNDKHVVAPESTNAETTEKPANNDSVTVAVPIHEEQQNVEKISKPVLSTFDEDTTAEDITIEGDGHDNTLNPANIENEGYSSVSEDERDSHTLDPGLASEIGVINQYEHFHSAELLSNDGNKFQDEYADGIEEVENDEDDDEDDDDDEEHEKSNLAKSLRPKFETTPEIIEPSDVVEGQQVIGGEREKEVVGEEEDEEENSKPESEDTLLPPGVSVASSSKSSISSAESGHKRPIKSAMKSTSSFTTPTQGGQPKSNNHAAAKGNAAQQAYLSLTTAENTRLNSKLSNPSMTNNPDFALSTGGPAGAYPQFVNPQYINNNNNVPGKRLSQQTLRKPQQGQRGLQGSQRPFSTQQMPTSMSSRSLRPNSYVQPIQPHPALQPGYQSPSKMKAEALYAKAQSRPHSQFKPVANRSSSYSRAPEQHAQQQQQQQQQQPKLQIHPPPNGANFDNAGVPPRSPNRSEPKRTTLRSPSAPAAYNNGGSNQISQETNNNAGQAAKQSAPQASSGGAQFRSRLNDSDDDLTGGFGAGVNRSTFKSRFNDSDDDLSSVPVLSLRQQQQHNPDVSSPKKEKKFKKLRKLFGGSKD